MKLYYSYFPAREKSTYEEDLSMGLQGAYGVSLEEPSKRSVSQKVAREQLVEMFGEQRVAFVERRFCESHSA